MPEELATVTGCLSGSCYKHYIHQISAAIDRDPLDAISLDERGLPRYFAGELAAAERDWRRILEINPDYEAARYYIAQILIAENKPTEALAIASDARLRGKSQSRGNERSPVALGRRSDAEAELRDMIAHDANDGPREMAEVYATLGDKQKAIDWLQRDYDGLHAGIFFLRWNPLLRNLADEPRFRALMDKILGLAANTDRVFFAGKKILPLRRLLPKGGAANTGRSGGVPNLRDFLAVLGSRTGIRAQSDGQLT